MTGPQCLRLRHTAGRSGRASHGSRYHRCRALQSRPTSSGWVVADRNGKYQGNDGAECPPMPVAAQVRLS